MVKTDNFVPVQDLAGNILMVEPDKKKRGRPKKQAENITMVIEEPIKKRGRPKKYSTAEEARKAKIVNTIASAKKRKAKQGKGVFIDHIKSIFTGTAEPSEYVLFVLAKVALYLLHRKSKKILKDRYGIEGSWFPILKLLAQGTKEAYNIAIGQGGANIIRNLGQVVVDNTDLQDDLEQQVEGSGLFSNLNKKIKGAVQAVASTATAVVNKVKDTATAVVYGRQDYPPKVRKIISQYGGKNITGITLGRTPLGTPLLTALQVASGNTFSQKLQNTPYDKLFHLFMCIELDSSSKIILEKNEVINAEIGCKLPKDTETQTITSSDIPQGLTLNEALEKTRERMGGNYFTYSAKDNNCQDFIVSFLTANNIGSETDKSWVKQETKVLFEGNDRLRKIANTLTDIGARVDVLTQGAGIKGIKPITKEEQQKGHYFSNGWIYDKSGQFVRGIDTYEGYGIIDFEDMKWGSFSKQLQAYNSQHKKKLDLHNFAMMILANPDKFQERTKKRARFYINVILKKGGMIDEENDPLFQNPVRIARRRPQTPPPPPPPPPSSPADDEANKENIPPPNPNIQGRGIKKSPVNNIGMANSWINYVKAYAKKNNMKYSEALKDPKCKAGYKKGGKFDLLQSITDVGTKIGEPFKATTGLNPFTFGYDLGHDVIAPALMKGRGVPSSRDEYIAELYNQANLGANGKVRLN